MGMSFHSATTSTTILLKYKARNVHYRPFLFFFSCTQFFCAPSFSLAISSTWLKSKASGQGQQLPSAKATTVFCESQKKRSTLFENYSKCRIWVYEFWHFPPIFVLLKLTCLVTLFDRKLQVFKNSPKWNIFGHFQLTFVHSKCKHNSLCSQRWMRLFLWFSNTVKKVWKACF